MEIRKRNRAELRSYFVKNAIPTEGNFTDLIDAVIVQASDGVAKPAGEPLSVEAIGDDTSRKQVLNLYRSFADNGPAFTLELSPRSAPSDPASARPGLSISDAAGTSRLFIDATTGNLGIGTQAPTHTFHVRTESAVGLFESTSSQAYLWLATNEGLGNRVELANRPGGRLALATGTGDVVNILRDGRVAIGHTDPQRDLEVGRGGQIAVGRAVEPNTNAGLFWHPGDAYGIMRAPGPWNAPDYQQLVLRWHTGIVLEPGTAPGDGYARSFVEVRNSRGLRISDGTLVVGGADPGPSKVRVVQSATDFINMQFAGAGCGELRMIGWDGGWNLNANTNGKHLYLNRDAGASSNLYLGRAGLDIIVMGDGKVSIGGMPDGAKRFTVRGDATITGMLSAPGGVDFGGDVPAHVDTDGVLYRHGGQAYIVVDDNLYIRHAGGDIKFHFDTANGVLRQDGWTAAPLEQGWSNYASGYNEAAYYRDKSGVVHLRGLVRAGVTGGSATIFTLPAGYRPPARELRVVQTSDRLGRVDVLTDGRVVPYSCDNGWVSLDGISFRVV